MCQQIQHAIGIETIILKINFASSRQCQRAGTAFFLAGNALSVQKLREHRLGDIIGETTGALPGLQPATNKFQQGIQALLIAAKNLANMDPRREFLQRESEGYVLGASGHGRFLSKISRFGLNVIGIGVSRRVSKIKAPAASTQANATLCAFRLTLNCIRQLHLTFG